MNAAPPHDPGTAHRGLDAGTRDVIARLHVPRATGRMLLLLVVLFVGFSVLVPGTFLNPVGLQNIGVGAPEIGLIALAMTIAMLTGGIDLSIVAIANAAAIVVSSLHSALAGPLAGTPAAAAVALLIVLAGVLVGAGLGAVNGLLIGAVGVTPILATLGTMQLFNGLAVVATGGVTVSGAPQGLTAVGRATLAGVPVLFLALLVVALGLGVLLDRTAIGHKIRLQGANPLAARFSGIDTRSTLVLTYVVSGALGGAAGLAFLARNPSASADYGSSYVLLAIVIAVLGGTNPNGGRATVVGVVLATLTLQVISSGFIALRLSAYDYSIAQGVLLIAVMVVDALPPGRRRRARRTAQPPVTPVLSAPG